MRDGGRLNMRCLDIYGWYWTLECLKLDGCIWMVRYIPLGVGPVVKPVLWKKKLDRMLKEIPDTPKIVTYRASLIVEAKSIVKSFFFKCDPCCVVAMPPYEKTKLV